MPAAAPDPAASSSSAASNAARLARSNLLRLESSELLGEAFLHVHPGGALAGDAESSSSGDARAHHEARWAPAARGYVGKVAGAIGTLGPATLGPEVALLPNANESGGEARYRVPLLSDKFARSLQTSSGASGGKGGGGGGSSNPLTSWSFPFRGGASLTLAPIGSFAHAGNAGLSTKRANGGVLPVLDVAVLVDGSMEGSGGGEAFVGGKDYLNHRYTDKRNLLAVHIAKQLSQKKHRSTIGAVHLTRVFGDARKVGLLLTPPLEDGNESKQDEKRKRKRGAKDGEAKEGKGNNKLRFRVRLIFGVNNEPKSRGAGDRSGDEESESHDGITGACWIPPSRLLPDRTNHRSSQRSDNHHHGSEGTDDATPHYTNSLAEDVHLLATVRLVNSTISTLRESGAHVSPTSSFHETLLLLKVWALQRGFLRGHDTFTTTTLAVILVYLYRTKAIGKRMGCIQAFTAFMKFWGETDWLGEEGLDKALKAGGGPTMSAEEVRKWKAQKKAGWVIPEEGRGASRTAAECAQSRRYLDDLRGASAGDGRPRTLLDCYKYGYASSATASAAVPSDSHRDAPVLLDPTMTLNYLARLSPSFVRESRSEAQLALRIVHGHNADGNESGAVRKLFLETNRFWTRYDAYVRVPLASVPHLAGRNPGKGGPSGAWGRDAVDVGIDESACRGAVGVLSRALGDRATAIRAFTSGNGDARTGEGDREESERVATSMVRNSDQCPNVPVRGSADLGYAAHATERLIAAPACARESEEPALVIGLRLDPDASRRIVDRGPPAEDAEGAAAFAALWGEEKAQLRRFRDGAIVRAAVWNEEEEGAASFCGMDRSMGGIAERIVRHVIGRHFMTGKGRERRQGVAFALRGVVSFIDGVAGAPSPYSDSLALHKNAMAAFDSLADFLRRNTSMSGDSSLGKGKRSCKLGLPLSIDEVEPLAPCLRYASLFPPVPHPLLGGNDTTDRKVSGANVGAPILIQIRFEGSSRWPASLNAMGAAKCAMLVQLADGIEKMKEESRGDADGFDGPMDVTPNYLDLGFRGYSWRIIVRADQELRMLRGLKNPTQEAKALQLSLVNRHVRGSMHHSLTHAVHTRHPSSSSVVRLAHRWVGSHMLSDMMPLEAIELMVAKIYTESAHSDNESNKSKMGSIDTPPSTVVAGFLRFLDLLARHDWAREPLIVDPQNHISSHDSRLIHAQFNAVRGPEFKHGPAMYVISPADYDRVEEMSGSKVVGEGNESAPTTSPANATEKVWAPTVTACFPEKVVLSRAAALARCSHDHLIGCIQSGKGADGWVAAFQESSSSLTSYSALLRVDSSFIVDSGCSSTNADCGIAAQPKLGEKGPHANSPFERSLQKRFAGPKELRQKQFKNLVLEKNTLHEWQPVKALVNTLRSKYSDYAVFFYNQFTPEVIAVIWRPNAFKPQPFSAIVSEFKRPVTELWKEDSLVLTNTDDLMEEMGYSSRNIVSTFKVFDDKKPNDAPLQKRQKKSSQNDDDGGEESSSGSEQE